MDPQLSALDRAFQLISRGVDQGILHLYEEGESLGGNRLLLGGRAVFHFGSCSYLGLEFDRRLKEGACQAVERYGTQFSSSRAYLSLGLYRQLEDRFRELFGHPCVIAPTTSLAHVANLPVLVGEGDAVLMDHQVHQSVQTAARLLKARGTPVELLRHNRMDRLEERLEKLSRQHPRVWYLADGIYSMFGDACPVAEVRRLLEQYETFHFYVDDAHGLGLYGCHGQGYVLDQGGLHPRMVLATSLAKAFACGGAVTVFPSEALARKVRTCGGPLVTSGPLPPATLGAALAAARIFCSPEIGTLQEELRALLDLAAERLAHHGLPLASRAEAAVFFVPLGQPRLAQKLVQRMLLRGYYVNLGIFPAVPMHQAGIRFTVTRLHRPEQVRSMVDGLAEEYFRLLEEEEVSLSRVCSAFQLPEPVPRYQAREEAPVPLRLQVEHYPTIEAIDYMEWNSLFGDRGCFDYAALLALESLFRGHAPPENNWAFDYWLIRDLEGHVVVATFTTAALWKDDLLAPAAVSERVEKRRREDPYFLTSRVLMTGSLLTEGAHVYIRQAHPLWQQALGLLLDRLMERQEHYGASHLLLRDFDDSVAGLDGLMADRGLLRLEMPPTHTVEVDWKDEQAFYGQLSRRSRQHFREDIRRHAGRFTVQVHREPADEATASHWYGLYQNVRQRNLALNTFALPPHFFREILRQEGSWEVLTLQVGEGGAAVAMVLCYLTRHTYVPLVMGLDYGANQTYKVYRQALYQLLRRAAALGKSRVHLGFTATTEKKKLGATPQPVHAYWMSKDSYALQLLGEFKEQAAEKS